MSENRVSPSRIREGKAALDAAIEGLRVIQSRRGCKIQQGDVIALDNAIDLLLATSLTKFAVSETSQITTSSDHYRNGWNEAIDRAILICEGHDRVIAVKELRALMVP